MFCLDCKHSKVINNENGEAELRCLKFDKEVFSYDKCLASSKFLKEERAKRIYLQYYKTEKLEDIAHKIGWTKNKLLYFIEAKILPKKQGVL